MLVSVDKKHCKSAIEPWFLVSNLVSDKFLRFPFVNLYKRRMGLDGYDFYFFAADINL
jgi:hypothetical protein